MFLFELFLCCQTCLVLWFIWSLLLLVLMLTFLPPHHQCIIASSCGHFGHLNGIFVALRHGHGAILFSSLRFMCSYIIVIIFMFMFCCCYLSLSLVAAVVVVLCSGRCCCSYISTLWCWGSDLEPATMYFLLNEELKNPTSQGSICLSFSCDVIFAWSKPRYGLAFTLGPWWLASCQLLHQAPYRDLAASRPLVKGLGKPWGLKLITFAL